VAKKITFDRVAIIHSHSSKSLELIRILSRYYNFAKVEDAELIIVVGGDGELLHAIHKYMGRKISFYGINAGTIGFLMNEPDLTNLADSLKDAIITDLYPLQMLAEDINGNIFEALAMNEVSIFRSTNQAAKIAIEIDGILHLDELISDGVLVSTPAGSSAYNLSAGGPIVPLGSNILCLTPICSFRPRRWSGALLPSSAEIKFNINNYHARPVNCTADFHEFSNIKTVTVKSVKEPRVKLLFEKNHSLESRIIKEQFAQ